MWRRTAVVDACILVTLKHDDQNERNSMGVNVNRGAVTIFDQ